jgi:hypothetical protein
LEIIKCNYLNLCECLLHYVLLIFLTLREPHYGAHECLMKALDVAAEIIILPPMLRNFLPVALIRINKFQVVLFENLHALQIMEESELRG